MFYARKIIFEFLNRSTIALDLGQRNKKIFFSFILPPTCFSDFEIFGENEEKRKRNDFEHFNVRDNLNKFVDRNNEIILYYK